MGSLQTPVMRDLVEKFATVGYLDVILEANQTDEEYGEDARRCRKLNAEHGIHLLQQMLA